MVSGGTKRRHTADRNGTKDSGTNTKYKSVYCLFPVSVFGAFPYVKNGTKSSLPETGGGLSLFMHRYVTKRGGYR